MCKLLIPVYISVQEEDSEVDQNELCNAKGKSNNKFTK